MVQDKAATIPDIPWVNGNADVIPLPGSKVTEDVPLENVPQGSETVFKSVYPKGKVLIPPSQPGGSYAILPLVISYGNQETVNVGSSQNPNGVVILFKSK